MKLTKLSVIFIICFILGAVFNLVAVSSNGGKMPVKTDGYYQETEHHLFYYEGYKDRVAFPFLADIISINQYLYFSIGDILILAGAIGLITMLIQDLRLKWRNKDED